MQPKCRFCGHPLEDVFVNLGMSPLSNAYVKPEGLRNAEAFYPLTAYVCPECFLVQLEEFESPKEIFSDYAYFSSYSQSWLEHCSRYADRITDRLRLSAHSLVTEIASNDGYLLQYFVKKGIPVLGVDPAANVAQTAIEKGVPTEVCFFGEQTAKRLTEQYGHADLMCGNNVLAHVPDINDFVEGFHVMLAPGGVATLEFPHLLNLMRLQQFDTIYHEHFSYLSFTTVQRVFAAHGLRLFDVDELPTHGGSLRVYACHQDNAAQPNTPNVARMLQTEKDFGLTELKTYHAFEQNTRKLKREILSFLIGLKEQGKTIAGYGAPAKGNTLLNYCGVRTDFLDFTVDLNPAKAGTYLPGTHIPVYPVDEIAKRKPDYLVILPWNLRDEIMTQCAFVREWGCQFVTLVPKVEVL